MMTLLSVLVFVLVQGFAVCDELYPISVLRDITENQLEASSDNTDPAIQWIQKFVVPYGFVKHATRDEWETQPTFQDAIGTTAFEGVSKKVKKFFSDNPSWEATKKKFSCIDLLYITAARYLFVTQTLYDISKKAGYNLIPCARTVEKKYVIPNSGVCYPAPPSGSATCTSDYDVSLVGKDAGFLIDGFNNYFQVEFKKPSDFVFDTNVYAFTLAYASPVKFIGLSKPFVEGVAKREGEVNFKMQELASAYYKVFKYNVGFFEAFKTAAERAMNPVKASQSKIKLNEWLRTFSALNANVKMRIEDFNNLPQLLREAHNNEYQKRVKKMSEDGGYKPDLLGDLAKAEIYAAEAYHTRGAIRHVVVGVQMKLIDTPLSTNDLWVSMIENWGESNKEYNHCKSERLEKCFLKMCKYLWRVFNAMRLVRERIPANDRPGLVHFGEGSRFSNPEFAMNMWVDYKKDPKKTIAKHKDNVKEFLRQFQCNTAVMEVGLGKPFPTACISNMNDKVNAYNRKLAALVTDVPERPPWRI